MKILITLFFILNISLFGYEFSNVLPENTIFYAAVEDLDSIKKDLNSLPEDSFYKSDKIKKIKESIRKISSIAIYNEENEMTKINVLLQKLEKLVLNSFSFSIALDKLFKPQYTIIIKGEKLNKALESIYKEVLKKEIKAGKVTTKKQLIKNTKVDVVRVKDDKDELLLTVVYADLGDKLVITSSIDYMSLLLTTISNNSVPKLSNNPVFKKDKVKYKNSNVYMFLNLKSIIKLSSIDKDFKNISDKLSLDNFDSLIFYSIFTKNKKTYDSFFKLTTSNGIPSEIKAFLKQTETMRIPKFIPDNSYSFNAFHLNPSVIYDILIKVSSKKDLKRLRDLELTIGTSIKTFFEAFGSDFYFLNFFENQKDGFSFIFSFDKPTLLVSLIRMVGANSAVGMSEKDYLDGKIFVASSNFDLIGYGLGYKNNTFILGNVSLIKEIMQKMGGKSGSFYNSKFYKKIQTVNIKKQNIISLTDYATSIYLTIKDIKKNFNKSYGNASSKEGMKTVKVLRGLVDNFASVSIESWKKYFKYSLLSFYINKNELVLELGEIK